MNKEEKKILKKSKSISALKSKNQVEQKTLENIKIENKIEEIKPEANLTNQDVKPDGKKKKIKKKKTHLEKWQTLTFVLTCIGLGFVLLLFASPAIYGIFLFFIAIFWLLQVFISTLCTLGLCWANEGYRKFNDSLMSLLNGGGQAKVLEVIKLMIPYVAPIAGGLALINFALVLILFLKHNPKPKGKFIASCIITGLTLTFIILCLAITLNLKII